MRLLLCASLFLASCGEQTELEQPGVTNGETVEVTKEIQISVLPMQTVGGAATRSASDKPEKGEAIGITYMGDAATRVQTGSDNMTSDESTIKNAYIVQFNGTDPTSTAAWVSSDIKGQLSSGSAISCGFVMTAGKKNRVYVVANVATAPSKNMTLNEFEKPVNYTPSASLPTTGLPMSAMQDIGVGDVVDVFQLKSVLAKLKFTCSTVGATLKLKGVPSGYSFHTQAQPGDNAVRPANIAYNNTGVALTSGTTYYVPENLSGRNDLLIKHYTRALGMATANAMYVEITNSGTVYNLLLGDGSASDFNFAGGYVYNINATLYGVDAYDLRVGNTIPVGSTIVDMNASGETANCYVATAANTWYMFNSTVMGNGKTTADIVPSKLYPASADVLWESVNSLSSMGDIVNYNIYLLNGRILFQTSQDSGNAVIAAKDASNNIIWSWHIWRTEGTPVGLALAPISGKNDFSAAGLKLMDRNLGALRATPAIVSEIDPSEGQGTYYQWGRKDPFPDSYSFIGDVPTAGGGSNTTPLDAVKHPITFFTNSGSWCSVNGNLWGCPITDTSAGFNQNGGSKTIYDPCPVGWRVPPAYTFHNATRNNIPDADLTNAADFSGILTQSGVTCFIPFSGRRESSSGTYTGGGAYGYFWTASPAAVASEQGSAFRINFMGRFEPLFTSPFAYAHSVRCIQE